MWSWSFWGCITGRAMVRCCSCQCLIYLRGHLECFYLKNGQLLIALCTRPIGPALCWYTPSLCYLGAEIDDKHKYPNRNTYLGNLLYWSSINGMIHLTELEWNFHCVFVFGGDCWCSQSGLDTLCRRWQLFRFCLEFCITTTFDVRDNVMLLMTHYPFQPALITYSSI